LKHKGAATAKKNHVNHLKTGQSDPTKSEGVGALSQMTGECNSRTSFELSYLKEKF
jgi:hypothetical protein